MLKLADVTKTAYASGLVDKAATGSVKFPSSFSVRVPLRVRDLRTMVGPDTMAFGPRRRMLAAQPRGARLSPISGVTKAVVPI